MFATPNRTKIRNGGGGTQNFEKSDLKSDLKFNQNCIEEKSDLKLAT